MRLAEWVREALLSAPTESGPDSGEVALGEILALRSLLLNLHFRAAKGEPVAESEMRGLIERADGTKIERARERMAAVRAAGLATVRATEPEPETAAKFCCQVLLSDGTGTLFQGTSAALSPL
jgi:hypothetical protein